MHLIQKVKRWKVSQENQFRYKLNCSSNVFLKGMLVTNTGLMGNYKKGILSRKYLAASSRIFKLVCFFFLTKSFAATFGQDVNFCFSV